MFFTQSIMPAILPVLNATYVLRVVSCATCGLITEGEAKECSKDNQLPSSEAWARQVQVILRPLLPFISLALVWGQQ
jgi:hypothetical protein